jgi:hypothetical protein
LGTACDPGETFGLDDVTRLEVEAIMPAAVVLPGADLPALPMDAVIPVRAVIPIDVLQSMREAGAGAQADLIKRYRDKAEHIEIEAMLYEVMEPNGMPVDIDPVELSMVPVGATSQAEGFPLGVTVPVPAGTSIATRELTYHPGGLEAAEVVLQPLQFTLLARTRVHVPANTRIEANRMLVRVRFKVRVHIDLGR